MNKISFDLSNCSSELMNTRRSEQLASWIGWRLWLVPSEDEEAFLSRPRVPPSLHFVPLFLSHYYLEK